MVPTGFQIRRIDFHVHRPAPLLNPFFVRVHVRLAAAIGFVTVEVFLHLRSVVFFIDSSKRWISPRLRVVQAVEPSRAELLLSPPGRSITLPSWAEHEPVRRPRLREAVYPTNFTSFSDSRVIQARALRTVLLI